MNRQTKSLVIFGALFVALFGLVRIADPYPVRAARDITFDQLQRLSPRPYIAQPVRVVDIDEASLNALGQWPWSRDKLAEMVRNLRKLDAAAIVFDIAFAEPDRLSPKTMLAGSGMTFQLASELPDFDAMLAQAAKDGPVVLAFGVRRGESVERPPLKAGFVQAGKSGIDLVPQFRSATPILNVLQRDAAGVGSMSLGPDTKTDVIRKVPLLWSDGVTLYPGLALEALRVALGETTYIVHAASEGAGAVETVSVGDFTIPTNAVGEVWMRYRPERFEQYVSAQQLIGNIDADALAPLIAGNIILIGTSATGLLDLRTTALGENVPGVSIHAQLLEQILGDTYLLRADWITGLEIIATTAVGLVVLALVSIYGPALSLFLGGVSAVLVIATSWLLFQWKGMLFDPSFVLASGLLTHFAMTSFRYLVTDRQARFIHRAFSQYVAPAVLARIEKQPDSLQLGGEIRNLTIMFVDIRNFTNLSESLSPAELVAFLNKLLSALSNCVVEELGTIDKYIGDSVMAFWNAPVNVPDHPLRACRAALAMRERVRILNDEDAFGFRRDGRPFGAIEIGIGINTGPACVGNMGSETRFNYSAVGDAVNLAARVESACKDVGFDIVVSAETAGAASELAMLDAGTIQMKGKSRPQRIFLLLGGDELRNSPGYAAFVEAHEQFMSKRRSDESRRDGALHNAVCEEHARLCGLELHAFYSALRERQTSATQPRSDEFIAASKQILLSR